jgi:predicted enzyme related to lactoylglutathione lyase
MSQTATATAAAVSPITWFEIPTVDFDRARRFYETILDTTLDAKQFGPARIAIFPHAEPGITGCLDEASASQPAAGGTVVYLRIADGRLDRTLALVQSAGGSIAAEKIEIEGVGWVANILDTEGNRVGLHAIS